MEITKDHIGSRGKVSKFTVTKEAVQSFADAIGDDSFIYSDESYALTSAYGQLMTPLTFAISFLSKDSGLPIDLDVTRILHAEHEFIFHKYLKIGETYNVVSKVSDIYTKEGRNGEMQFLNIDTECSDLNDELILISRNTLLYRKVGN